jgi:hypothetical protein
MLNRKHKTEKELDLKSYPHPLTFSRIFRIFKGEEGGLSAALTGEP